MSKDLNSATEHFEKSNAERENLEEMGIISGSLEYNRQLFGKAAKDMLEDFKWLNEHWKEVESQTNNVENDIKELGVLLRDNLDLEVADLDESGSKFFKSVYHNSDRVIRKKRT